MANDPPFSRGPGVVSQALHVLVSKIPVSTEAPNAMPDERVKSLATIAALKAGAISGSFTLPPGPFGMATVLPDLLAVWRIQQQLVADIAAAYGKSAALTPETMIICLFKHGGAALTRPLLTRGDDEVVVSRIANRTLLQLLEKIAVRVVQRIAAKSAYRWLPVLGALGAGAYSFYDTTHVANNAIELFSQKLRIGAPEEPAAPAEVQLAPPAKPPRRRPRSAGRPKKTGPQASATESNGAKSDSGKPPAESPPEKSPKPARRRRPPSKEK